MRGPATWTISKSVNACTMVRLRRCRKIPVWASASGRRLRRRLDFFATDRASVSCPQPLLYVDNVIERPHEQSKARIIPTSKQFLCNQCVHSMSFVTTSKGSYYSGSTIVSRCASREDGRSVLTSSKQIGHLVSLSSFFHSLNVPVGRDVITSSGVALERTSPNMLDNDNSASYESSNSSSG